MKTRKKPIKCPYCGHTAVLRDASYVYGENAVEEHLYVCSRYQLLIQIFVECAVIDGFFYKERLIHLQYLLLAGTIRFGIGQ